MRRQLVSLARVVIVAALVLTPAMSASIGAKDKEKDNKSSYNSQGYDQNGYDKNGYDHDGYDRSGCDRNGYDRNGYDKNGYDHDGYDHDGYDRKGHDRHGFDKKDKDDDKKVTICHREGNGSSHTITVSKNAVNAHLGHGDTLGACSVSPFH